MGEYDGARLVRDTLAWASRQATLPLIAEIDTLTDDEFSFSLSDGSRFKVTVEPIA